MECNQIIATLKTMSSEKYKANVVRLGIPKESSIGISTDDIRKLAKTLKTSNKLAYELKETGNKAQRWIAKDALKELETLIQVKDRERLISSKTKMGKEQ